MFTRTRSFDAAMFEQLWHVVQNALFISRYHVVLADTWRTQSPDNSAWYQTGHLMRFARCVGDGRPSSRRCTVKSDTIVSLHAY